MEFTKECLKGILLFVLILYDMRRKRDAMRENLEKYGEVIAGSILLSLGIWLFVTPNGLNFGGVIGTSQIIEVFVRKLLPIPKSMNIVGIINFMISSISPRLRCADTNI